MKQKLISLELHKKWIGFKIRIAKKNCDKMICPQCGTENADNARFCGKCGRELDVQPQEPAQQQEYQEKSNKFVRCADDKQLGGVCSGFAKYIDADVSLVRILTVISFLISGSVTFWAYILCWIIVPEEECGQR